MAINVKMENGQVTIPADYFDALIKLLNLILNPPASRTEQLQEAELCVEKLAKFGKINLEDLNEIHKTDEHQA